MQRKVGPSSQPPGLAYTPPSASAFQRGHVRMSEHDEVELRTARQAAAGQSNAIPRRHPSVACSCSCGTSPWPGAHPSRDAAGETRVAQGHSEARRATRDTRGLRVRAVRHRGRNVPATPRSCRPMRPVGTSAPSRAPATRPPNSRGSLRGTTPGGRRRVPPRARPRRENRRGGSRAATRTRIRRDRR